MNTYKIEIKLTEDGTLTLKDLPFKAGDEIEIVILERCPHHPDGDRYPLRGKQPYSYDEPTEPVALEDWDVLQ